MMQKESVSLIIPAYNEEKYIKACLEHVIEKSNGVFSEIIVVDNASTDRTAEIAKSFPGVTVLHELRKGPTFARQRGYEESKGDILAFIDADTQMPGDWTTMLTQEFNNNEELACLSGPYLFYDFPEWKRYLTTFIFWHIGANIGSILFGGIAIGGNFVIRRDVLKKMSGFDMSIAFYGDDTDIARRAEEFGEVKFKVGFMMPSSARRFRGQGLFKTMWLYLINYLSEVFMQRPVTEKYLDIR